MNEVLSLQPFQFSLPSPIPCHSSIQINQAITLEKIDHNVVSNADNSELEVIKHLLCIYCGASGENHTKFCAVKKFVRQLSKI